MKPEYQKWIVDNYPSRYDATLECTKATERMTRVFPELRRVRGTVAVNGDIRTHWWCVCCDSEIVDPTAHQWDLPIMDYTAVDESLGEPKCLCLECGKLVFASKYSNHCDPCGDTGCRF